MTGAECAALRKELSANKAKINATMRSVARLRLKAQNLTMRNSHIRADLRAAGYMVKA